MILKKKHNEGCMNNKTIIRCMKWIHAGAIIRAWFNNGGMVPGIWNFEELKKEES